VQQRVHGNEGRDAVVIGPRVDLGDVLLVTEVGDDEAVARKGGAGVVVEPIVERVEANDIAEVEASDQPSGAWCTDIKESQRAETYFGIY